MWPGKLAQYSSHDACRVVFTRFTHLRLHDLTVFGHSAKESHLGICGFTVVEGSVAIVAIGISTYSEQIREKRRKWLRRLVAKQQAKLLEAAVEEGSSE